MVSTKFEEIFMVFERDNGKIKVLERRTETRDENTGEVIIRQDNVRLKTKEREQFMLLFVKNFSMITELRRKTQEFLALVLSGKVTYGTNEVVLDGVFRYRAAEELNTTRQTIVNSIVELTKKGVFKKEKRKGGTAYYLNPYIFGQGEWNAIEKQRQQFIVDYDFKNYTAKKEFVVSTAYEGLPNKDKIEIVDSEIIEDGNMIHRNITIKESERDKCENVDLDETAVANAAALKNDEEPNLFSTHKQEITDSFAVANEKLQENEKLNDKEIELAILKEQNKARELEFKAKELEIRELELKIELAKLQGSK